MPSFLRLNGIVIPVSPADPSADNEDFGGMKKAIDGTTVFTRRTRKNLWKFSTPLRTAAEAIAYRELVAGAGHVVNFDTQTTYTSKGMAPVSVAVGWGFATSGMKYGAACAEWTTGNAVWAFFSSSSPWTLAWWTNQSGAGWHHYVQTSAGTKWIDGVLAPAGTMLGFVGVTAGVATFGSATTSKFDDLVALPYVVPSTWPAQIYGYGSAFGALPVIQADGLYIEQNSTITVVGGSARSATLKQGTAAPLHSYSFELWER